MRDVTCFAIRFAYGPIVMRSYTWWLDFFVENLKHANRWQLKKFIYFFILIEINYRIIVTNIF
jgi:hypothetical protein